MPIQGLSNQWKTYDALLDRFASLSDEDGPGSLNVKYRMIRELLAKLHEATDSIIYVGTSHEEMNFGTSDVMSYMDRSQPFAYVDVVVSNKTSGEFTFRIETREIDCNRPTSKWIVYKTKDAEEVAKMVLEALLYADVPQRQSSANTGGTSSIS